jgi:hypothetical protein
MTSNATSAVRQHAVSVTGVEGAWAKVSGGVASVDASESYNGGAAVPDLTMGRKKVSNLTVDRPFNPVRDRPVIRFIESQLGSTWSTTVTDQDLAANEMAIGTPTVYTGCVPISVTGPEFDTEKSDASRVVVEFRVQTKT